jgi:hypothetical protein
LTLHGCDEVQLSGPACRLNPIAMYEDGMTMTVLRPAYAVKDLSVLEVREDGTIVPKQRGETDVTVAYGGLATAKRVRVRVDDE